MRSRCWRRTKTKPMSRPKAMTASGCSPEAVRGQFLDAVDHGHHGQQGQDDAGHVHPARVGVPGFRNEGRAEDQQRQHDRHGHQQYRAPPEVLHQPAAEDRAERGAAGEAGGPDGDGQPAPVGVRKDVADQGQGGRHQHGAEETQPGAPGNQPFGAGGKGCGGRNRGKASGADSSSRRRPILSPRLPMATRRPARTRGRRPRSTAAARRRGPGCGRWPAAQRSAPCCPRPPGAPGTSAGPGPASRATAPLAGVGCRRLLPAAGVQGAVLLEDAEWWS